MEHARIFKPEYDSGKPSIIYEEFLIAIAKILQKHSISVIDNIIERYKIVFESKNNLDLS